MEIAGNTHKTPYAAWAIWACEYDKRTDSEAPIIEQVNMLTRDECYEMADFLNTCAKDGEANQLYALGDAIGDKGLKLS